MNDPHETKLGIVSDGTRRGTLVCDPKTEAWKQEWPPVRDIVYEITNGIAYVTLKIAAAPARIKGVVTEVEWVTPGICEQTVLNYVARPEKNPLGRRMHFECSGVFADMRPLDKETETIFREMPFVSATWKYENDEFALSLKCVTER